MDSTDPVKPEKLQKFWNAYRACVEAHHIPPQRSGFYVRWVQELLGHANVETTMIYTHVLNRPGVAPVKSPLDAVG